jgi:hypothetical protein
MAARKQLTKAEEARLEEEWKARVPVWGERAARKEEYKGGRVPSGLSRDQRRKLREWRGELGRAIWDLNEGPLMSRLRLKHEVGDRWTAKEIEEISVAVFVLRYSALEIRNELKQFVARATGERRLRKKLSKEHRERLGYAVEMILIGATYLEPLTSESLDLEELIEVAAYPPTERRLLAEMGESALFFDFCPVLKKYEGKGPSEWKKEARDPFSSGCYTRAIKALRVAFMQLFFTLQAKDVRKIRLTPADSFRWHEWQKQPRSLSEILEPELVAMAHEIAADEGRSVHLYDEAGEVVYEAVPQWLLGGSLKERAALKQSKKVRQQWWTQYTDRTPADVAEFRRSLSAADQRKVSKFLQDREKTQKNLVEYLHRAKRRGASEGAIARAKRAQRQYTMMEIAALLGLPFRTAEEAAREKEFQRKAAVQFRANPEVIEDIESTTDIAHDAGLIRALWMMDLD